MYQIASITPGPEGLATTLELPVDSQVVGLKPAQGAASHAVLYIIGHAEATEMRRFAIIEPGDHPPAAHYRVIDTRMDALGTPQTLIEIDPPAARVHVPVYKAEHYDPQWPDPFYGNRDDAGFDLRAAVSEAFVLEPRENALVPTGLYVALPRQAQIEIRPRSGLGHKHMIAVTNSPGTIDAPYRGEIKVSLENRSGVPYTVEPGDRIAQGVVMPYLQAQFAVVADYEDLNTTDRGATGFGDSGRS